MSGLSTKKTFALVSLTITSLSALPALAQNIDTVTGWDGITNVASWGTLANFATPTYGQSITVPVGKNTLNTFLFKLAGNGLDMKDTNYTANVFAWDATTKVLTGSALWSSGTLNTGTITDSVFSSFSFSPNVTVNPGSTYMLFLTTAGVPQNGTPQGYARWGVNSSTYSGGDFFASLDASQATLSTNPWFPVLNNDLAFTATFSSSTVTTVTPELPGGMLLIPALLPVALVARRKRKG